MTIYVTLSIKLVSVANLREHWAKKAKRNATHRNALRLAFNPYAHEFWTTANGKAKDLRPIVITITRIAPRALDTDNLASSAKAARDGIADALTVSDNHPNIEWRYAQEKGRPREYAVRVEIRERT